MTKRQFVALVSVVMALTAGLTVFAVWAKRWGPHSRSVNLITATGKSEPNAPIGIGIKVPDVTLTDVNGERHSLKESRGQVVVLVVQGNHCPCSAAYVPRLNALYRQFGTRGVQLWAFNSNANETVEQTKAYAVEHGVRYPLAYDTRATAADMLGAACMTESWVIDRTGVLRYHGRIDDNIFHPSQAKSHDLQDAISAVLANTPIKTPETEAYACTIQRPGGV